MDQVPIEPDTGVEGYSWELGARTRKMSWNLTVNSNVVAGEASEVSVSNDLEDGVDDFFNEVARGGEELDIFDGGLQERQINRLVWAPGQLETGRPGSQGNRIHYHGVLTLYHYSPVNIRLNLPRLIERLNSLFTYTRAQDILPHTTRFRNPSINGVNVFFRTRQAGTSKYDPFNYWQYAHKKLYAEFDEKFAAAKAMEDLAKNLKGPASNF